MDTTVAMETKMLQWLLIAALYWQDMAANAQNTSLMPTYQIRDEHSGMQKDFESTRTQTYIHTLDSSNDGLTNLVNIYWLNSTTTSISIAWNVSSKYAWRGYIKHSSVECFSAGGRFTSHPLSSKVKAYTFENLNVNTLYSICVNVIEAHGPRNASETTHSKCVRINTIDYLRRESAIWMLVALGYYIFMGLLGYTQWRRKMWSVKNRNRKEASESNCCNNSVRWRDLAERERLCTAEASCSIEEHVVSR